jgi:hypothetical protein
MLLFTMTPGFLKDQLIDGYSSAIWTERFFQSGDVEILCPLEKRFVELLAPGTLVGHGSSREVAVIENHEVEDGLLKATGPMLDEALLKNRMAWFKNPEGTDPPTSEFKLTSFPGEMLAVVLTDMVINPVDWTSGYAAANLDWDRDKIPNLTLGFISEGGLERPRTFPIGPLSDGLRSFATAHGMGYRIYLESASDSDYSLVFSAWFGRDLTSRQDENPLVRLSPNLNSLMDTKEVLSISEYKNVAYVYYDGVVYTYYAEPDLPIPEGLDRRVMVREATGDPPPGEVAEYLAQHAYDAFANNNYIRAIDGQASIPSPYRYQEHYRLGDIIELEGITGNLAKARVTEYIRAQDEGGDHEYPTVSVVDPLDSGNWPDTDDWDDWDPDDPWPPDPDDVDPDDPDPTEPRPKPYPKRKKRPKPLPPPGPDDPDPDPDPDPPPPDPDPPDPDDPDDWPVAPPGSWMPIDVQEFTASGSWDGIGPPDPAMPTSPGIPAGTLNIPFSNRMYKVRGIFTGSVSVPPPYLGGGPISMSAKRWSGDLEAVVPLGWISINAYSDDEGVAYSPPPPDEYIDLQSYRDVGYPGSAMPEAGEWGVYMWANSYPWIPLGYEMTGEEPDYSVSWSGTLKLWLYMYFG